MADSLRVVMVSTEAVPFAKTGGLADVMGALPKALQELQVETTLLLPKYQSIDPSTHPLQLLEPDSNLTVRLGQREVCGRVWQTRLPRSGVPVFLIENDPYFGREGLYVDPHTKTDYPDNAERFIFFMRMVLQLLQRQGQRVDVIHCNDYQTGLIPAYLKVLYARHPWFGQIATLYSIHNLAYQGLYKPETMALTGFGLEHFYPLSPFEFWGRVNFMKAGLVYADIITTVSERYAREIRSSAEYGCGLEGVLAERAQDLYGVINGIDYDVWNPALDPLIPYRYDADHWHGKSKNKEILQRQMGLTIDPSRPLIGMVTRLTNQKGLDLIAEKIDALLKLDLQLAILGTGQPEYHALLKRVVRRYSGKIGIRLDFDNPLAHLIEAGADMFLMPSRYEPCGLNQLYSLKYGTIPIVRATGGLADTVKPFDQKRGQGTGFVFHEYNSDCLLQAVIQALTVYENRAIWVDLMKRAMAQDFSWQNSARQYRRLYQQALVQKRSPRL